MWLRRLHRPAAYPGSGSLPAWRRPHRHRDRGLSHRRAGLEQSRGDPGDDSGQLRISRDLGNLPRWIEKLEHPTDQRIRQALKISVKKQVDHPQSSLIVRARFGPPEKREVITPNRDVHIMDQRRRGVRRHDAETSPGGEGRPPWVWLAAPVFPVRVRHHPV